MRLSPRITGNVTREAGIFSLRATNFLTNSFFFAAFATFVFLAAFITNLALKLEPKLLISTIKLKQL